MLCWVDGLHSHCPLSPFPGTGNVLWESCGTPWATHRRAEPPSLAAKGGEEVLFSAGRELGAAPGAPGVWGEGQRVGFAALLGDLLGLVEASRTPQPLDHRSRGNLRYLTRNTLLVWQDMTINSPGMGQLVWNVTRGSLLEPVQLPAHLSFSASLPSVQSWTGIVGMGLQIWDCRGGIANLGFQGLDYKSGIAGY